MCTRYKREYTARMINRKTLLPVLALIIIGSLAAFLFMQTQSDKKSVTIGETRIEVEVVDTIATLTKGLSGRESLEEGTGMLFVFPEESDWGIWMKDMLFAVDILWARSDGTIIGIAKEISPESYPDTFAPDDPTALYVLEVPAGFVDRHGIADGMKIVVQ